MSLVTREKLNINGRDDNSNVTYMMCQVACYVTTDMCSKMQNGGRKTIAGFHTVRAWVWVHVLWN